MQSTKNVITNFKERRINPMRKRVSNALLRGKITLANQSGDQMTGWLIVVLVVVVVGAVFMTLYQGSITSIWNSIVSKITNLLN
jgi:hypothetical protein